MATKMSPKMKAFEAPGKDKGVKEGSKKGVTLDKKQTAKMPAFLTKKK